MLRPAWASFAVYVAEIARRLCACAGLCFCNSALKQRQRMEQQQQQRQRRHFQHHHQQRSPPGIRMCVCLCCRSTSLLSLSLSLSLSLPLQIKVRDFRLALSDLCDGLIRYFVAVSPAAHGNNPKHVNEASPRCKIHRSEEEDTPRSAHNFARERHRKLVM